VHYDAAFYCSALRLLIRRFQVPAY
jgi:hypothetical protein